MPLAGSPTRPVSCALGWREGDRLTLTASPGVVTARRDPRGMVSVPARGCLAIPAVLRRRCGLRAGDRVLLAAVPGQDILAAYTTLTWVKGSSASRSPKPTQATKTAAGEQGPWPPWPPTSAPGSPK